MSEPEFLPSWYPRARQRRRWLALQGWATAAAVGSLAVWFVIFSHTVWRERVKVSQLNKDIDHVAVELNRLDELIQLREGLTQQEQIMQRIGLFAEPTRVLRLMENALSPEMSLLTMSFDQTDLSSAPPAKGDEKKVVPVSRTLRARVHGVAPTDMAIGNFVQQLNSIPFVEAVTMNFARERTEKGHVMREFEVTFSMNLTQELP